MGAVLKTHSLTRRAALDRIHRRRPKSMAVLALAVLLLGASACATPAAAPTGVMRVAMQAIDRTDPAFISSDSEVFFANHVYDYLVDIDPHNQIVPRLATDWSVSDDGLSYRLTLANDVTFHNGDPLHAADVVWTFQRLADAELGTPTADLYRHVRSIEATGELEVTFTLDEPNPFFLYDLSDNHAVVLQANTADPSTSFNGTGPFQVESYSPEDRLELTANPDYFVDGVPKLAGIELIFFADENATADALRGGQVDLMLRMSTPIFETLQAVPGVMTYEVPTNGFDLIRLRTDRPPGNDPRVVRALKLATNRAEILQLVQGGHGAAGRDSPIGPLFREYYSEATPLPQPDPQAASQLLARAGYPDGLRLQLHTPDTGGRPDLATVLKQQWAAAGVELEVLVEPETVYYGDDLWLEVDLGITGWGSRPIPQFYLDVMLVCGAVWNESHFCDSEFDRLASLAGSTMDESQRVQAYQQIQRILIERGPVIIPYFFAQFAAIREGFDGFQLKAFAGRTDLSRVGVLP